MYIVIPTVINSLNEIYRNDTIRLAVLGDTTSFTLLGVCVTTYALFLGGIVLLGSCAGNRLHNYAEEIALEAFRMDQRYRELLFSAYSDEEDMGNTSSESSGKSDVIDRHDQEDREAKQETDMAWAPPTPIVHDLRSSQIIS